MYTDPPVIQRQAQAPAPLTQRAVRDAVQSGVLRAVVVIAVLTFCGLVLLTLALIRV